MEDAAESLGATYKGVQTGLFGDYGCISFNGNNVFKIDGDADFCNTVLKMPLENLIFSAKCTKK